MDKISLLKGRIGHSSLSVYHGKDEMHERDILYERYPR